MCKSSARYKGSSSLPLWALNSISIHFILCVRVFCLQVCLCIPCESGAFRGQRRAPNSLELELAVVSCHVLGNKLGRSSQCSLPMSHLSSPSRALSTHLGCWILPRHSRTSPAIPPWATGNCKAICHSERKTHPESRQAAYKVCFMILGYATHTTALRKTPRQSSSPIRRGLGASSPGSSLGSIQSQLSFEPGKEGSCCRVVLERSLSFSLMPNINC